MFQYNKKYYYKIGNGSSAREFWFFTPPKIDPDAAYKFGIIGIFMNFNSCLAFYMIELFDMVDDTGSERKHSH
jgi:hypothetical protein